MADLYIDETLQTLQYASRVKSIKNKPILCEADELRYLRAALTELRAVRGAVQATSPSKASAALLPEAGAATTALEDEYVRALAVADQERQVTNASVAFLDNFVSDISGPILPFRRFVGYGSSAQVLISMPKTVPR